jgi:succinyl-CoA synthetase beta subunit
VFSLKVYTADAKLGFDDNASFRQRSIFDMEDTTESEPREVEAARHNLSYVQVGVLLRVMPPPPELVQHFRL